MGLLTCTLYSGVCLVGPFPSCAEPMPFEFVAAIHQAHILAIRRLAPSRQVDITLFSGAIVDVVDNVLTRRFAIYKVDVE